MSLVDHERSGALAYVWLNRAELRNAFNAELIGELTRTFALLAQDAELRVVVLGGRGTAFCAGGDLQWMQQMAGYSWEQNLADAQALAQMLWSIASCPVPVVARVHGDAFAGGVGLVAACDIAIAADSASFCLSEVKLGLVPATISPYVIRAIGERSARRYGVSAERFDAQRAHRLGLIHEVCAASELDATVQALAQAIAANAPLAVRASKQLITEVSGQAISPELREHTARRIADVRCGPEARAGLQAFLSKTRPPWQS